MTEIQVSSKWSDVKPTGFYVYVHRRQSDGLIFYVGKGCLNRAWCRTRNVYWKRVATKHGVVVDICQDNMNEDDAFLLEYWLIAKLRHEGVRLTNKSEGGDGPSGFKQTEGSNAKRSKSLKEYYKNNTVEYVPMMTMRRGLTCSNGMKFNGAPDAIRWLSDTFGVNANQRNISACARGKRRVAYGFSWRYTDTGCEEGFKYNEPKTTKDRKVLKRSDGRVFESLTMAVENLRETGWPRASAGTLSMAASGKRELAYGFSWAYA